VNAPAGAPVRVYFPCTGLGREARGFEAFTRDCADALRDDPSIVLSVFGGGGAMREHERAVFNLPRRSTRAAMVSRLVGRDPYFVEQASFFAGFLPALIVGAPDVVYFADLNFGNACWHWRRISGQKFKLLFYNGGATTKPFTRCDLVQQVSPEHLSAAVSRGEDPARQVLLPHGLDIDASWYPADDSERRATRESLGVPTDRQLLISVGMLGHSVKRCDAVIRAVALLPEPRPHLMLLGAETNESAGIRQLAARTLGSGCTIRSVSRDEVLRANRAADAFVIASLREGFGMAHLEALAEGLPCVATESETSAYLGGAWGIRGNVGDDRALARLIARALGEPHGSENARAKRAYAQHAWIAERFGWAQLAPRYAELFRACAAGRRPQFGEGA
jgi:1,2-diacylglycerol 3-alpha-glucosyltransferase